MTKQMKGSVYIHVPFCVRKCAYCDFYSLAGMAGMIGRYIEDLCREIRMQTERFGRIQVETVYFGGGTPTLLSGEDIRRILSTLREYADIIPECEITMEGNPGTLKADSLDTYREAGVNRFSVGVQSFSDRQLEKIGRIHTAAQARTAVKLLRQAGFFNVNLDIMYGLPGQTPESLLETIGEALMLSPEHLSCYSLIPEPGTEMGRRVESGEVMLPGDEEIFRMEEEMRRMLKLNGFERYEVSNYAREGRECRHNLVYWECEPYLGFGPGAHSDFGGKRFTHPADLAGWMEAVEINDYFEKPEDDGCFEKRRFDRMMMGLRMVRGVDIRRFCQDFGQKPEEVWPETIREMRHMSMIREGRRLALTERGMDVMNTWLVRMMEEEEKSMKS